MSSKCGWLSRGSIGVHRDWIQLAGLLLDKQWIDIIRLKHRFIIVFRTGLIRRLIHFLQIILNRNWPQHNQLFFIILIFLIITRLPILRPQDILSITENKVTSHRLRSFACSFSFLDLLQFPCHYCTPTSLSCFGV